MTNQKKSLNNSVKKELLKKSRINKNQSQKGNFVKKEKLSDAKTPIVDNHQLNKDDLQKPKIESRKLNIERLPQKPSWLKSWRPLTPIRVFLFNIRSLVTTKNFQILVLCIITTLVLSGFIFFSGVSSNPNSIAYRIQETDVIRKDPEFQKTVQELKAITANFDPQSYIYDKIQYDDLPIYPKAWVERHFSQAEIRNALITGPEADFDGDNLTNKQEYLYGSDPKNKYSLCGTNQGEARCKATDRENVDAKISPLTGLELEVDRTVLITKQDRDVIKNMQNSFDTASAEGVDFPILYQLSKQMDLSDELAKESFLTTDNNRESFTDYVKLRLSILDKFLEEDEKGNQLGTLMLIYKSSKSEELDKLKERYQSLYTELKNTQVPELYVNSHRTLLLLFKKVVALVDLRKEGVTKQILETEEYRKKSKDSAVQIVWAYRQMNEELLLLDNRN